MATAAKKSHQQTPSSNEFTKRQKNLIRVAVNGNNTSATNPSPTTATVGQVLNPLNELNLHDFSNSDDFQMQLSYAVSGGRINATITASRQSSQSTPELLSLVRTTSGRLVQASDYNSDGEAVQTPPALRLCKGTPVKKGSNDSNSSVTTINAFQTLQEVMENGLGDDRVQAAVRGTYGRVVDSSRLTQRAANGRGKPPPSRLPVRAQTKAFIVPHISKPPSMVYRGRIINSGPPPNGIPSLGRPAIVGASTVPTQVVIGAGGIISVPSNTITQSIMRSHSSSVDQQSAHPIDTSVYTSATSMMSFQPLSVTQKPLLLPTPKESLNPDAISRQELRENGEVNNNIGKSSKEVTKPYNGGRRSSKSRLCNRRESAGAVKTDPTNGTKTPAVPKSPGKRKPKSKAGKKKSKTPGGEKSDEVSDDILNVPVFVSRIKSPEPEVQTQNKSKEAATLSVNYDVVSDIDALHKPDVTSTVTT